MSKIATRTAYGKALVEFAKDYPNLVVLDADLSGSTKTKDFSKAYPDRFFNMGIAEGGMVTAAAGLAAAGKIPFASSFAVFASGRAWEQIRTSVTYPHLNVKIVGTHAGLSVGEDGATHQATEDIAIMRAIPGMLVVCPCDGNETRLAVKALLDYDGPAYLRLGRADVETVTDNLPGYEFQLGKGTFLKDGSDVTIIATGLTVQMSLEADKLLQEKGISARIIDMHTIKPLDEEMVLKAARETGCLVTAEEHNIIGGLGGAVAELTAAKLPTILERVGLNDEFGRSGKAAEVLDYFGISPQGIVDAALRAMERKKALGR